MNGKSISVKNFINMMAKFSISSWVNFIIGIATVGITTRLFTPDVYGALNMFNTTTAIFVSVSCLGLDGAFIRFYYEPPEGWDTKQLFAKCLIFACAMLFLISVILCGGFYAELTSQLFHTVSFYFAVLLSVNALSLLVLNNFFSQYYRIGNDPYHYTIQQILVQLFSKLFVVSAAFISPAIDVVLTMNTLGIFSLMLVYFCIQKKTVFPEKIVWSYKGFWPVLKFALFYWPQSTVLTLNAFIIPFIITSQLDSYSLGIYASAGFFVSAFGVIQGGFRTYWSAFMYEHYKDEQAKIIKIHSYVIIFIILLLSGFILVQHIVYLLIGSEYHASRLFFSLVLVDPLLSLLEQTTEYGTNLAKKNHQNLIIFFISVTINIVGTYLLLPLVGLMGAAMAAAAAATVRFVLATWRGQKYYVSIEKYWKTFVGMFLIVLLAVSNCIFVNTYEIECLAILSIMGATVLIYHSYIKEMIVYIQGAK